LVFDVVGDIALSTGLFIESTFTDKAIIPVKLLHDVFWQTEVITLAKPELDLPCNMSEFCLVGYQVIVCSRSEHLNFFRAAAWCGPFAIEFNNLVDEYLL
jgi:hypothetical protein